MRIASATYSLDFIPDWDQLCAKWDRWVANAAHADLLLFPEYGGMELAALEGPDAAADMHKSLRAASQHFDAMVTHLAQLAKAHGVHICAPSTPVVDGQRIVNRAALITPKGKIGYQDKQIMTRFEAEEWGVSPGCPLQVFDTALGPMAILICYDSEFPLLGRAVAEAETLLIPSCTEALSGYTRVRIGAQARALEGQCITVMSSLTGEAPKLFGVESNIGKAGIFCPPDKGFPQTGIITEAGLGAPGWVFADVDPSAARALRKDGHVLNHRDWSNQVGRDGQAAQVSLIS